MCITIGAGTPAVLTGTKLYAGEAIVNDKYVHVLAYQNNADSDGPNAMIIPFPTDVPMGPENTLDTSKYKNFLTDISEASKHHMRSAKFNSDYFTLECAAGGVAQVFDVGSYTVILADNVAQVPAALQKVSLDKRPEVTTQFLLHYGRMYPKQPVALCCWSGYVEAEPLLWMYEPKDKDTLFIPTMDAHDGGPPDLSAKVETDHIISVGSNISSNGATVHYSDFLYEGAPLLPKQVHGTQLLGRFKNGDMFVSTATLRGRQPIIKRGANLQKIDAEIEMRGWH
jgi:hypothetical protein